MNSSLRRFSLFGKPAGHTVCVCAVALMGILFLAAMPSGADAVTVTKLSWDSKEKYTRFVMEFDSYPKCRVVDSISDKGYFYVDIYGMATTYRRRLLNVNDNTLRYIDAVSYPEHNVLRLVFYLKDLKAIYKISRVAEPVR